ncbi:DUF3857 domain-containing protein [bacterium]|nr:DUF3857 domain-containing protein [bacterium]
MKTPLFLKGIALVLLGLGHIQAQDHAFSNYHFDPNLTLESVPVEDRSRDELILLEKQEYEFMYDEKEEKFWEYVLFHQVVYVNSLEAVEDNNKVYYPVGDEGEVLTEGCRVVDAQGSKVLGPGAVREVEEEGSTYRYYAVEGLSKGNLVDYYFAYRRPARSSGRLLKVQKGVPIQRFEFELRAQPHLEFDFKALNSDVASTSATTADGLKAHRFVFENLPALVDEPFSNPARHGVRLAYKLEGNNATGKSQLNSYAGLAENFWSNVHLDEKKVLKKVENQVKKLKINEIKDQRDQIRAMEDWMKREFGYYDSPDPRLENMQFVLDNKALNDFSSFKLMVLMADAASIPHQIVLTSDRFNTVVPTDYECYCFLSDYLIYFPDIDAYMQPSAFLYRLGMIAEGFTENMGLFISSRKVGNVDAVLNRIAPIPAPSAASNVSKMRMSAKLDPSMEALVVDARLAYTGYEAAVFQSRYSYVDADLKAELDKALKNWMMPEAEVLRFQPLNTTIEDFMRKPFELDAQYASAAMVEQAGNALLVKAGMLIGPQSELYQEKKRTLPVEQDHPRTYDRVLTIEIPEGYDCANLSDLDFNVVMSRGAEGEVAVFRSRHSREAMW